jgi:hypothetical protein
MIKIENRTHERFFLKSCDICFETLSLDLYEWRTTARQPASLSISYVTNYASVLASATGFTMPIVWPNSLLPAVNNYCAPKAAVYPCRANEKKVLRILFSLSTKGKIYLYIFNMLRFFIPFSTTVLDRFQRFWCRFKDLDVKLCIKFSK